MYVVIDAMSSKVVEIIREYVLQTLAQQGSIPYRITQKQFRAATDSVVQCLESASMNRDASPRVVQREATMLALQSIPRAIADASVQLDDGPSPPPTGSADTQPAEDETSIDDLVQRELARRQEQDAAMGVTPPTQPASENPPNTREQDTSYSLPPMEMPILPSPQPASQLDTLPPQPASQPEAPPQQKDMPPPPRLVRQAPSRSLLGSQPASQHHTTPSHTVAIPHNPEESSPIRIRYTPSQPVTQMDRVVMPIWVRGEDTPFVVCSVAGTDIYLFPAAYDPRILIPRPHSIPAHSTSSEMMFTFRTPDGELIGTDFTRTDTIEISSNTVQYIDESQSTQSGILKSLSGIRVKFRDDDEYRQRVYPVDDTGLKVVVPSPENEAPIESAIGNLRSPWAISVFITY